ncbi:Uncharacterised protein [uncultured archaeon]|nr:Uncharacterised protein [uncultured archaeon]
MGPKIKAVTDTGPIIHLREIGAEKALSAFRLLAPPAVSLETKIPGSVKISRNFDRNIAQILQNEFGIGIAESQCIALAKSEKISIFLTDDLDARTAAKEFGLEPHGTIGIILKAYRQKIFSKKDAIALIYKMKTRSTIYITQDLISHIILEIEKR